MSFLLSIDHLLTTMLRSLIPASVEADTVFMFFSLVGSAGIIWIIVVASIAAWEYLRHRDQHRYLSKLVQIAILSLTSMAASALSITYLLKPLVARDRPYTHLIGYGSACPMDYSFPSGHAAVAFAGAAVLSHFDHDRRRDKLYAIVAILVSYSRIYLACHYVSDVLAGALYGMLVAQGALYLARQLKTRLL